MSEAPIAAPAASHSPSRPLAGRVRDTLTRLNLCETRGAAYLGVPVTTLHKWLAGEREPNASVARLLDVLGTIEALAPTIHASFMPSPDMPVPRRRNRRKGESK